MASNDSRLHYLDAMRSTLMLLGLVLHSARPYDTHGWRVKDVQQMPWLDGLVSTLHLFRMPAFFVIAGFFAMYLVRRRPTGIFLRERMRRVLVPLVVVLFSVNVVQAWFVARFVDGHTGPFVSDVLVPAFWSGSLVSHLWFLGCLAIYFAVTGLMAPALRKADASLAGLPARMTSPVLLVLIAGAVAAPVVAAVAGKLASGALHQYLLGVVKPMTVLNYLPFYAVGLVLCMLPNVLSQFSRVTLWSLAFAVLGGVGMYVARGSETVAGKAVELAAQALLAWMAIRAVFALFRRFADRPSRMFRYLSDASYSIYLFHHLIVIATATALLPFAIGAGPKFIIVLATASIVSLAIYHLLIRRSVVLGYLFNGAVPPAVRPAASRTEPAQAVASAGVAEAVAAPAGHGSMPGAGRV